MNFTVTALTDTSWHQLETLFGERGACAGCWCTYFRQSAKEFKANQYEPNRKMMHGIVSSGEIPGLIGLVDGQPVAWIAIAPREATPRLEKSRVAARFDETPVWSITCLFVEKGFRRKGISVRMIDAASAYAFAQGAPAVEAYPIDMKPGESQPDAFVYHGLASAFRKAGFTELARRSAKRPLMRRDNPALSEV